MVDKYAEWGIKYVLIVGSHDSIPMRYCYPDPQTHNIYDWKVPTEYYYADLTGDWDTEGDGFYGESGNDDADYYPEVYVGRIPMDEKEDIQNFCTKTMLFEKDNGGWKQKALLLGAKSVYDGGCSDRFMEKLKRDILIQIGKIVSIIIPFYNKSLIFFFFPFYHIGGAERVHATWR